MKIIYDIRDKVDVLLVLLVLPLLGLVFAGRPIIADYIEFPPLTQYVKHPGFSWLVFAVLAVIIVSVIIPFLIRVLTAQKRVPAAILMPHPAFPWWGWTGLVFLIGAWILAWSRFSWFEPLQIFTFSPLWFGYIIIVNALAYRRQGSCMLLNRPWTLAALFLISAGFWWFFEYLNRFVQNWYYQGINQIGAFEYVVFATLPFSTVLPAVLSTYELLETFPRLSAGLDDFIRLRVGHPRPVAFMVFIISCVALTGIGVWPNLLFPMLWLSPLFIITSYQALRGQPTIFSRIAAGDWRRIWLLGLAALICGFFWEMWNYYSLAKWQYSVPFVERFRIFEMPLLGYAGYIPFGLECAVIAELILKPKETPEPVTPPFHSRFLTRPALINVSIHVNALIVAWVALYFFIIPGCIVMHDLADKAFRGPEIPKIAWRIHRDLASRYEKYARDRVASGIAARLNRFDVPSTEWPMFGSVYYLWATESLQAAWEKDHLLSVQPPCVYARGSIEAAVDLVLDPVHHTWVREHWGNDYLHTQNVFFRTLLIAAITSHEKLIGDGRHRALLRDQVDTLAAELDASPYGVLEDYPGECYPVDVFAAMACIKRADNVLGTDHSAFLARAVRGFQGNMLDERGIIPWFIDNYQTGSHSAPSRGTGNSYILIFAQELWPDLAKRWYDLYDKYFWQDRGWAAGFREFPKDLPGKEFTYDVDSGPIVSGFSPAANAFGLAAAKINGRLDHVYTLASQVLVASWPLPNKSLLGTKILSNPAHAPYLGEACMLFLLAQHPAPGLEIKTGGHVPIFVYIGYLFYFGIGGLLLFGALRMVWMWRRDHAKRLVPFQNLQFGLWVALLAGGFVLLLYGYTIIGIIAMLASQVLPKVSPAQNEGRLII